MAEKVIIQLTDDLDGSDASQTIHFAINGSAYRIDLSDANAEKFWNAVKPYIEAAQPAGSRGGGGGGGATSAPARAGGDTRKRRSSGAAAAGVDPKAVRVWADENNVEVPSRGRIPAAIIEQYKSATGG